MYADEVAFNQVNLVAYYGFENNLDCTNNATYNLTAQNPAENTYETGIIGQSRKFLGNPVYNDAIGQAINYGEFTIMAWGKNEINQSGFDFATVYELGASFLCKKKTKSFKTDTQVMQQHFRRRFYIYKPYFGMGTSHCDRKKKL